MDEFLRWLHIGILGVLGWVAKIIYGMNGRISKIEQWIVDRVERDNEKED